MKLWDEFKAFAFKGNMIDLAVAVVIGKAFSDVIGALVANVIMPIVSYVPLAKGGYETWMIGNIKIGEFLAALVNFIIIALAVFLCIVKLTSMVVKKPAPAAGPPMKECPLCLSTIPAAAKKCAHCTADLA